jgi:hypothetical protein
MPALCLPSRLPALSITSKSLLALLATTLVSLSLLVDTALFPVFALVVAAPVASLLFLGSRRFWRRFVPPEHHRAAVGAPLDWNADELIASYAIGLVPGAAVAFSVEAFVGAAITVLFYVDQQIVDKSADLLAVDGPFAREVAGVGAGNGAHSSSGGSSGLAEQLLSDGRFLASLRKSAGYIAFLFATAFITTGLVEEAVRWTISLRMCHVKLRMHDHERDDDDVDGDRYYDGGGGGARGGGGGGGDDDDTDTGGDGEEEDAHALPSSWHARGARKHHQSPRVIQPPQRVPRSSGWRPRHAIGVGGGGSGGSGGGGAGSGVGAGNFAVAVGSEDAADPAPLSPVSVGDSGGGSAADGGGDGGDAGAGAVDGNDLRPLDNVAGGSVNPTRRTAKKAPTPSASVVDRSRGSGGGGGGGGVGGGSGVGRSLRRMVHMVHFVAACVGLWALAVAVVCPRMPTSNTRQTTLHPCDRCRLCGAVRWRDFLGVDSRADWRLLRSGARVAVVICHRSPSSLSRPCCCCSWCCWCCWCGWCCCCCGRCCRR